MVSARDDLAAYSCSGNSQIEGRFSDYIKLLLQKVGNIHRIIYACSKVLKINRINEIFACLILHIKDSLS